MKQGIILEMDNINAVIMTSDGEFLSVPAKASWQIGETVTLSEFDQKLSNRDNKNKHKKGIIKTDKRILAAIVAGLLLFLMPFSLISEADTYVTLDINPSIEFELKDNEVKNIRALNSDGEKLISQFNSNYSLDSNENSDLYFVTIIILEEAKKMGYLKTNEENIIMVGVSNSKNFKSSEYEQFIQDKLNKDNLNAQVVLLNATGNEKKLADEKGISLGRQLLLEKEKAEGILISDEQITNESIKSIFYTIEEKKGKNNSKYNGKINKEIEKPDKYVDTEKNNAEKNNNGFKEEDKQDEEEKKEKTESKKELTDKKQEEKSKNENDEREKAEDKEDQTQQKENNEEKNQDNKKKETNQNKESKENELDNFTDENAQDDETEENDQGNGSGDNNQDDQKDHDDQDDHDSIEENDENKNDIN